MEVDPVQLMDSSLQSNSFAHEPAVTKRRTASALAKRLILSASNAQSELIPPVHIETARQRKENDLEVGSAHSRDLTLSGQNAFRGR